MWGELKLVRAFSNNFTITIFVRKRQSTKSGGKPKSKKKKSKEADTEEIRAQRTRSRSLTGLFNRVRDKVNKLERLTPSWDWHFEVEKNTFNSRSSKHKYKSGEKASDLTKRVATDRLSRNFKECLTLVKKIESLDSNFVVTLRAISPESDSVRKKNIHKYVTQGEDDDVLASEGSQESIPSSVGSQEVPTNGDLEREEFRLSCRICRDDIFLQDAPSFVACLKPAGKAHFAAHFHCLGLYPANKSERMDVRSWYNCPAHC